MTASSGDNLALALGSRETQRPASQRRKAVTGVAALAGGSTSSWVPRAERAPGAVLISRGDECACCGCSNGDDEGCAAAAIYSRCRGAGSGQDLSSEARGPRAQTRYPDGRRNRRAEVRRTGSWPSKLSRQLSRHLFIPPTPPSIPLLFPRPISVLHNGFCSAPRFFRSARLYQGARALCRLQRPALLLQQDFRKLPPLPPLNAPRADTPCCSP